MLDARAWSWPLERGCVTSARAGSWKLERRPGSVKVLGVGLRRSSGIGAARAGVCEWRSSGVFDARAGRLGLSSVFWLFKSLFHFLTFSSLSYFSKNTIVEPFTLELYLLSRFWSRRSDLLIFGLYKKLVIVEGYILIWKFWVLEHVGFCHLLLWGSEFEVGICYSSLWFLSLNFSILRCWDWFSNLWKFGGFCVYLLELGLLLYQY